MRRRIGDQAYILEAIGQVRLQLRPAMTIMEKMDVMTRLTTLYALLDVTRLKDMVEQIDTRAGDIILKEAA